MGEDPWQPIGILDDSTFQRGFQGEGAANELGALPAIEAREWQAAARFAPLECRQQRMTRRARAEHHQHRQVEAAQ